MTEFTQVESLAQLFTFLYAALLGAGFSVFYDFIKAIRLTFHWKRRPVFFADLFFFLTCAILLYCFFLIRCSGEIRAYALFACLGGFVLWRLFPGRAVLFVFCRSIKAFRQICGSFHAHIIFPVSKFIRGRAQKPAEWMLKRIKCAKSGRKKAKNGDKNLLHDK